MSSVTILTCYLYEHFRRWSADHSEWATRDLWLAYKYDQARHPGAWCLTLYLLDDRIVGYRLYGKAAPSSPRTEAPAARCSTPRGSTSGSRRSTRVARRARARS
jgi:hypothetical protein